MLRVRKHCNRRRSAAAVKTAIVDRLRRVARQDEGIVAILTVLVASAVFIGLCALVVDLGLARDTRRGAQNAADASVLAAGNVLYLTDSVNPSGGVNVARAISAAKSFALSNYGVTEAEWASCTDASALAYHPDTACISFDSSSKPAAIRVNVPTRQVATPFAQIWGRASVPVGAVAQSQLVPGGMAQCGLCVIGTGTHDLQVGNINVSGANVAFNGILTANNGNGEITVDTGFDIDLKQSTLPKGTYPLGQPKLGMPAVVDPLGNLPMPDYSALLPKTDSCTQGPGVYASLSTVKNGTCTMSPGLYVITGTSGNISGKDDIVATGVTLYFTCGTTSSPPLPRSCNVGDSGGDLVFTGQGTLSITAPTTGPTKGLAIISDRNNSGVFDFRGNGTQNNSGTIYAKSGTLNYRGNGAAHGLDSLVVVKDVTFNGNGAAFNSTYTKSANVDIPPGGLHLSQ
jgi:Flp pilus assembly protein TadG